MVLYVETKFVIVPDVSNRFTPDAFVNLRLLVVTVSANNVEVLIVVVFRLVLSILEMVALSVSKLLVVICEANKVDTVAFVLCKLVLYIFVDVLLVTFKLVKVLLDAIIFVEVKFVNDASVLTSVLV